MSAAYLHDGEYGAETNANDENKEEDTVKRRMALGVEYGEEDETNAAKKRTEYRQAREDPLSSAHVRNKAVQGASDSSKYSTACVS